MYKVEYQKKEKRRERERTGWQGEWSIDEEEGSQAAEALAQEGVYIIIYVGDVLSAPMC